jgi:DNA-binding transcriptional LysR family regulator
MNVDLLQTLVAVADEGGYSRAARVLAVSQPAVYQRLQRLEASVGAPLLERQGRHMRLTPEGQVVYQHAHQIIRQLRLLEDAVAESKSPSEGSALAILVGQSLAEFPIPDICVGFQQEHPGVVVDFRVTARPSRDIDREIGYGRADIGIHSDPTPVNGLSKEKFYEEEYVALSWADHRFRELEVVCPEEFQGEPVVAYQDATFTFSQSQVEGWFARGGVALHPEFISNSVIAIREFVARRVGISIVPREHAVQTAGLIIRPLADPPKRTHYFVSRVTPHEAATTRLLRTYTLSRGWMKRGAESAAR